MLDKNQWLALGLLSGFAYILGKDRESFEAELLNAKELEKHLDEEFFPNDAVNINEYDNGKIISEGYIGMDKDEDGIEGLTMIKSQRPGYGAESFEAEQSFNAKYQVRNRPRKKYERNYKYWVDGTGKIIRKEAFINPNDRDDTEIIIVLVKEGNEYKVGEFYDGRFWDKKTFATKKEAIEYFNLSVKRSKCKHENGFKLSDPDSTFYDSHERFDFHCCDCGISAMGDIEPNFRYLGEDNDDSYLFEVESFSAESFEAETPCAVMVLKDGVLTECGWWNENNEPCVYHPDGKEINAESFEAEYFIGKKGYFIGNARERKALGKKMINESQDLKDFGEPDWKYIGMAGKALVNGDFKELRHNMQMLDSTPAYHITNIFGDDFEKVISPKKIKQLHLKLDAESFEADKGDFTSQKENMNLVALGRAHQEILNGGEEATMEIWFEGRPVMLAIDKAAGYFAINPRVLQSRYDSHNFVEPDWRDEYHQALSALKESFPSWGMFSPKGKKRFDL